MRRKQKQGDMEKIRLEQMCKIYYGLCARYLHSEASILITAGERYKQWLEGAFNLKLLPLL